MSAEPRTVNQMMADLLQATINGQWSDEVNTACHCHPSWVRACNTCHACESDEKHEEGCAIPALIEETRAFLRAENKLAEEQGRDDDTVYIP